MTRNAPSKVGLSLLSLLIAGVAALSLLWWVGQRSTKAVIILTPVLAILVMGFSVLLARQHGRRMDEVQVASQHAAGYHGSIYGTMLAMFLMSLPPVMNGLFDLVS